MLGVIVPIVAETVAAPTTGALPIQAHDAGADYETTIPLPSGATGYTSQTFSWTVADEPTWQVDRNYFANVGGVTGGLPAPIVDVKSFDAATNGSPTTAIVPNALDDQVLALVSGPAASSATITNAPPPSQLPLNWVRIPLPNNPASVAMFGAYDGYPLGTTLTVTASVPAGPITTVTVEAYEFARSFVPAPDFTPNVAVASSAGGGAPGSGAPAVTINPVGGYPSLVVGVGYDPTSAATVVPTTADRLDSRRADSAHHAALWVQTQKAAVTSGTSPVTLSDTVSTNDAWVYAAIEIPTLGEGGWYTGIQPYAWGPNAPRSLFSYFGGGVTSFGNMCQGGADGGVGVSCSAPIDWVIGHKYQTTVTTVTSGALTTWSAATTDVTANTPPVTIGVWTIPKSRGVLSPNGYGFTEHYYSSGPTCADVPYSRVVNYAPIGIANNTAHTNVTGKVTKAYSLGLDGNGAAICASSEVMSDSLEITTSGRPRVSPDGSAIVTSPTSASATVAPYSPGDLLVASVATFNEANVTVSGGGLTWTNVLNRRDTVPGEGGLISIWSARASSAFPASAVTVTSAITGNAGWAQTLNVRAYAGAAGVGQTAFASGTSASAPSVSITPQQTGSWVSSVGFDADSTATVTPAAGQVLDASAADNSMFTESWFQHSSAPTSAGVPVAIGDALSPVGVWDLGAVEIMPTPMVNLVSQTAPVTSSGNVTATVLPVNNYNQIYGGDLLVAEVSTTNLATVTVSSPTTPGLVWTHVLTASDGAVGDGGMISIWEAEVPTNWIASIAVQSTITGNQGWAQTLVVDDFNGAAAVGATAFASGPYTQAPALSLQPTATGSWISIVGFDGDTSSSVTPGPNQTVDASVQDTFQNAQAWFGHSTVGTTAGQSMNVSDTLSPPGHWDLVGIEVMPQT